MGPSVCSFISSNPCSDCPYCPVCVSILSPISPGWGVSCGICLPSVPCWVVCRACAKHSQYSAIFRFLTLCRRMVLGDGLGLFVGFNHVFYMGVLPFIPGELLKIVAILTVFGRNGTCRTV